MSTSVARRAQSVTKRQSPRRSGRIAVGAAVTAVLIGVATWALWPEPPRQREYLNATACLLTGQEGMLAEPASSAWSAMQQASVDSLVQVQYLPVHGPQTMENAAAYLTSLTTGQCGLIIATGEAQSDAVTDNAATYPHVRFIVIGDGAAAPNVQALDIASPEVLRTGITEQIRELADQAP